MVCIVVLNWNRWGDTIECLESVFRLEYGDFQVVLCDNDSTDGSLEQIRAWADGEHPDVPAAHVLRDVTGSATRKPRPVGGDEGRNKQPASSLPGSHTLGAGSFTFPPVSKPIRYAEYVYDDIERMADATNEDAPLILIRTGANRGFAGGNNAGLRYAMKRRDVEFVWLLNNDTVVCKDALTNMVKTMRRNPSAGICGSKILSYFEPDRVQSLGGCRFNKWLGIPRHIGAKTAASLAVDKPGVLRQMAYVTGTSMLVSRPFLNDVGLMDERYFLYYEEIDWVIRANNRYSLEFTPDSVVYHKEGASTGTTRSYRADFYIIQSRIRLTRHHFPYALPTVYLGLVCMLFNRIRRNQWDRVALMLRMAAGSSRCRPTD
ncbi:MAG TPA: glycosyltransferase family 2 protein [Syntrophus sp. (in: bacteria)]|nr:glycosyltransferase family 2 protein [Syntrophus sp. (in: bacteria)]